MTDFPVRAAIYARLSQAQTKDSTEESDSIANQLRDLRKLAKSQKLDVVAEFTDDGISGYSKKHRPGFQRLLAAMADGEVDVVLARHSDRLERNEAEGFQLRVASVKHGVRWMFASGMSVDPSTAEGGLLAKILSAIAEFESTVKTQRLLSHYDGLRTSGTFQAPSGTFGYDGADLVDWEADLIRDAYKAVAEGKTVGSIVRAWNAAAIPQRKGGKKWTYAHLNSILKRPRNAGLVADKDGTIIEGLTGQWERIVEPELWERVNLTLSDPSRKTSPGFQPVHMSGGVARCGVCGSKMRSNTVSDKRRGTRYKVIRCESLNKGDARHPSGRVDDLEPLIRDAIVAAFAFGPADLFQEDGAPDVVALQRQQAEIRQSREDILDLLRSRVIDKAEATRQLAQYEAPLASLQASLDAATATSASASMLVNLRADVWGSEDRRVSMTGLAELKRELGSRFDQLDIEQKRKLADTLLDIRVDGGRGQGKYRVTHKRVTSLNG